ncbi:MAG: helix-turn-helix domain-containing protein [Planctomycetota bacterium]
MPIGKRLLIYSPRDPRAALLMSKTNDWGCLQSACETVDELRSKLETGHYDYVLVEDSSAIRKLCAESDTTGELLRTPLAEVEKRHILRVLASTGGNKTRAAKILGIDTKTLYNRLKSYGTSAEVARRRAEMNAQTSHHPSRT